MLFSRSLLKHSRSTEWQQAHHGAYLQAHGIAVWKMKEVVEEPVLLVPHLVVAVAYAIHGIGDPDEVLKEAIGNLLVHLVVRGQNESNVQHGETVIRHPRRAVGLI